MADITQRVIMLYAKVSPYKAGDLKFLLPEIQFIYGDGLMPTYYEDIDTLSYCYGCSVSALSTLPNGWQKKIVEVPGIYDFDFEFMRDGSNIVGMKLTDLRYVAPITSALTECKPSSP